MADTLKDFLVSIGFKVDAAGQAKAEAAVRQTETKNTTTTKTESGKRVKIDAEEEEKKEKAAKDADKRARERRSANLKAAQSAALQMTAFAVKTIAAVEATATGVVYAVDKAAQSFDRLNYLSKRAGSTAQGATAFGYAASQTGSSVEKGQGFLQDFGQKLKMYPGYEQALRNLKIRTRDANGELRNSADLATDLGDALRKIQQHGGRTGYTAAMAQASLFGADNVDAQSIMDPRFRGLEADRKRQQGQIGADPNAAAQQGTAFEQSMRRLLGVVDDVSTKIETSLIQKLQPQLEALATWGTQNGAKIADFVTTIADGVTKLAIAFAKSQAVQDAVKGMAEGLETFTKYVGSDDFKKDVQSFAQDVGALAKAIKAGLQYLGIIPSGRPGDAQGGAGGLGQSFYDHAIKPDVDAAGGVGGRIGKAWRNRPTWLGGRGDGAHLEDYKSGGKPIASGNFASKAAGIKDRLKADFDMNDDDASAVLGNLGHESGGLSTYHEAGQPEGRGGVSWAQWTGPRRRQFEGWAKANNLDPRSDEAGYGFLKHELQRPYRGSVDAVKNAKGLLGKTVAFEKSYEGAGVKAYGSRYRYARMAKDANGPAPKLASPFGSVGTFDPATGSRPLGDTPALHQSIANSTRGDTNITHNPTFNIKGPDLAAAMSTARMSASRGQQDLLRNVQGAEQ